jgi:hypothetical protein
MQPIEQGRGSARGALPLAAANPTGESERTGGCFALRLRADNEAIPANERKRGSQWRRMGRERRRDWFSDSRW